MTEEAQKDTSSATWKFDFEDTVNADPMAKGACLGVIRSFLNYCSKADPKAFRSIPDLMLDTASTRPTVKKALKLLVKLKYLEPLFVTEGGSVMYRLVNARQEMIAEHKRIAKTALASQRADRKKRERMRKGEKETCPPQADESDKNLPPKVKETCPNTVELNRRVSCSEGREESLRVDSGYHDLDDLNPYEPFSIPDNDNEAEEILSHVGNVHPFVKTELRRMLMAGELTPVLLMSNFGGGDGKSA